MLHFIGMEIMVNQISIVLNLFMASTEPENLDSAINADTNEQIILNTKRFLDFNIERCFGIS